MNKENYLKLKDELKVLAQEIKNQKFDFKSSQRAYSTLEKEHGCAENVYDKRSERKLENDLSKNIIKSSQLEAFLFKNIFSTVR